MVDAVITWVDGSDPEHQKKRARFEKTDADERIHPKANHPTRFANKGELWYCVHSIRKYAPFIGRIFLVTDQQQPEWLTEDLKKTLNIHLVDHKVLFLGYEQYLPTFNSRAIETMLHRIPDLSDNFLYFNDDVILINPARESDYFHKHHLIFRGEWQWKLKLKKRVARFIKLNELSSFRWIGKGYIGSWNVGGYFKKSESRLFRLTHTPHPMNKKIWEQIFMSQDNIENQVKYRFRNKRQFSTPSLFANLAFNKGRAKQGPRDYGYLSCNELNSTQAEKWLDLFRRSKRIKSVCIQSLDQADPEFESQIKTFLQDKLNV